MSERTDWLIATARFQFTEITHGKSHPPHVESVSDGGSVPFTDRNNAHISSANSRTLPPSAVEQTHIGSCATSRALKSRHHPELIGVTLSNIPSGKAHMTTLGHHSLHQRCEYSFVSEAMYQSTNMFQMYSRLPAECTCDRAYLKNNYTVRTMEYPPNVHFSTLIRRTPE